MTEVTDLSHDDQVALWAGRIVRKEAQIETMLSMAFYELCGRGMSWVIVPTQFAPLARGVRDMLKAAAIDEDYVADGVAALDRLNHAHIARNRVVHDQWVQQEPGKFVSAAKGVSRTPKAEAVWDTAAFERCFCELELCYPQISGIAWSVGYYVGNSDIWAASVESNREAIAGRIKLIDEFSWEYTDPTFIAENARRMAARIEEFEARFADLPEPPEDLDEDT